MIGRALTRKNGTHGDQGFVIIVVLWILGALSILASVYATYVMSVAASVRNYDHGLHSEALVFAALELTAFRELSAPKNSRSMEGHFSFKLAPADVAVQYQSETTRIDLNVASKKLLAGLFATLGASSDDAELYAERVIQWRTPAPDRKRGKTTFDDQLLDYPIRGAKFPHPEELVRVHGLPIDLVRRALPFVTVYSGTGKVDILDAAPEVIASLPGMSRDRVNSILAARRAGDVDKQRMLDLLGPARDFTTDKPGRTFRVNVHISFRGGGRASSEAVILLFNSGANPYSILSWRDNIYSRDSKR